MKIIISSEIAICSSKSSYDNLNTTRNQSNEIITDVINIALLFIFSFLSHFRMDIIDVKNFVLQTFIGAEFRCVFENRNIAILTRR